MWDGFKNEIIHHKDKNGMAKSGWG